MMAKITKGGGFKGAIGYALDKKDARLIDADGVRLVDVESIAKSMEAQAQMKPNISKPVAHISLDFSVQDAKRLTDQIMAGIAKEYMQRMGFTDTQYICVRHHDREHPHCHLIINRINNDGKCISDRHDRKRSADICKELTRKYGLYFAQGKENVKRHRLKEPDKTRYAIYDAIKAAMPHCRSWDDLASALRKQGISANAVRKGNTDQVQGLRFNKNGYTFSGSKIDRSCGFGQLAKQLHQNEVRYQQEYAKPSLMQSVATAPIQTIAETTGATMGFVSDVVGSMQSETIGDEIAETEHQRLLRKKKKKGIRRGW